MRKILFLTGTRADFGKLKPLINRVKSSPGFEYHLFVTGMHLLSKYGYTASEISKSGFDNVFHYMNQVDGEDMEVILANTIAGLSRFLHENHFDLIVVHGDRVEALAGATVGALRNIPVAHVEGGEISGTVDELMRHAISKLSHLHFVASDVARKRLLQLGESEDSIFVIGSPDIDVMLSPDLPALDAARDRYGIPFDNYALAMLHPVTTELDRQKENAEVFVKALIDSQYNFILIYPNNDNGSDRIIAAYDLLYGNPRFKIFPSIRFEYFLTFLKHADFIIGNSSAGVHEAPVYGVPTINIGSRQNNRFKGASIFDVDFLADDILAVVKSVRAQRYEAVAHYGMGDSADKFINILRSDIWNRGTQKYFLEREILNV